MLRPSRRAITVDEKRGLTFLISGADRIFNCLYCIKLSPACTPRFCTHYFPSLENVSSQQLFFLVLAPFNWPIANRR